MLSWIKVATVELKVEVLSAALAAPGVVDKIRIGGQSSWPLQPQLHSDSAVVVVAVRTERIRAWIVGIALDLSMWAAAVAALQKSVSRGIAPCSGGPAGRTRVRKDLARTSS